MSALEVETAACDEGLKLDMTWLTESINLEMDFANAVMMLMPKENDNSALVHLISSIKRTLEKEM